MHLDAFLLLCIRLNTFFLLVLVARRLNVRRLVQMKRPAAEQGIRGVLAVGALP